MIWDLHVHLTGVDGATPKERLARMIAIGDRMDIERYCVYEGTTWIKVSGHDAGESTPEDLAELATRHPDVPLICGHRGGDWERGLRTLRPWKNVYAGLAGADPVAGYTDSDPAGASSRRSPLLRLACPVRLFRIRKIETPRVGPQRNPNESHLLGQCSTPARLCLN